MNFDFNDIMIWLWICNRDVSNHAEAYVRRSVLFAASCILIALHPTYVASSLIEGNQEISGGLEWIRTWALHVSEADPDTECASVSTIERLILPVDTVLIRNIVEIIN